MKVKLKDVKIRLKRKPVESSVTNSKNKGSFGKYGYKNVAKLSIKQRQDALKKIVPVYGAINISKRLYTLSIYQKNTNPNVSKIFKEDSEWVRKKYLK